MAEYKEYTMPRGAEKIQRYDERLEQEEAWLQLVSYFSKAIMEELGKEKALEIIFKAWSNFVTDRMNWRLQGVPPEERLKALGDYFKEQAAVRPWVKVVEATPKRLRLEVSKCLTYDVCKKHGVPEICQKYCDSDYVVARAIHPKVKLIRDKEIAYGAAICNHCYVMED